MSPVFALTIVVIAFVCSVFLQIQRQNLDHAASGMFDVGYKAMGSRLDVLRAECDGYDARAAEEARVLLTLHFCEHFGDGRGYQSFSRGVRAAILDYEREFGAP